MRRISKLWLGASLATITACGGAAPQPETAVPAAQPATPAPVVGAAGEAEAGKPEFKGKISKRYDESEEWWPEPVRPPAGAPNVLLILLDDTGFAQLGSFGGQIKTPNIDKLAEGGLRYNNFHTTALCSPSRASIMAGRNPHSIGLGSHSLTAMGFPGYNAMIPDSAKSVARTMQLNGYVNYAVGKWDHTPLYEVSPTGPFNRWPSGEGFDRFYGFMAADADQFRTLLYEGHAPVEPWKDKKDYHLTTDMADKTIEYVTAHASTAPDQPFMVFWAPGAMHSPHQAPNEYLKKYKGAFDGGWDEAREAILAQQKKLGVVPANTKLTDRPKDIPAWDSLPANEKKLYARQMEVFAAMLEHTDDEIGRMLATLKRIGRFDNTIIMVTSDNGASGEGGLAGTFNETYVLNGLQTELEANLRHLPGWGTADSYPHYHAGWAMAGNTPFRYFKQSVHRGGIHDPLIIHWPTGIKAKGEIRSQYHHIADIAPTLLDSMGLKLPEYIDGHKQQPMDGVSMRYSFDNANAPNAKKVQYYEMFGNRAIWADGWKAVSLHGQRMPWNVNVKLDFEKDKWELYHVAEDFSGSTDLAAKHPEKLEALKKLFDQQAWKYNVYPLHDDMIARLSKQQDRLFKGKTEFTFYAPGAVRIAEKASPPIKWRSHTIETTIDYKFGDQGVLVACGGFTGGYSIFIKNGRVHYDYNFLDGMHHKMKSKRLRTGETKILFKFIHEGKGAGKGELYINGEKVDETPMPRTHFATFSLSESFDVGRDSGTTVTEDYKSPFSYTGELDKVTFKLQ